MVSPLAASKAYAAIQKVAADPAQAADHGSGSSFAQLVDNAISQAVQTSRQAEAQMTAQAQGKANLIDVVTAVSSAQTSLQTMVAVRDQVIAAYQQILGMQI
jgi:flagellar hook-basal body complex protein FliE